MTIETIIGLLALGLLLFLAVWLLRWSDKEQYKGFPHSRGRNK